MREATLEELARAEQDLAEYRNQEQIAKEIEEIEHWFKTYDRVCNEHARCLRMGTVCHHNIEEWDNEAISQAGRLVELRQSTTAQFV